MHVVQRYQAHNQSFMALPFGGAVSKALLILLITSQLNNGFKTLILRYKSQKVLAALFETVRKFLSLPKSSLIKAKKRKIDKIKAGLTPPWNSLNTSHKYFKGFPYCVIPFNHSVHIHFTPHYESIMQEAVQWAVKGQVLFTKWDVDWISKSAFNAVGLLKGSTSPGRLWHFNF